MMTFEYVLNGEVVRSAVEGDVIVGRDEVLSRNDDDLTRETPWSAQGYVVTKFVAAALVEQLRSGVRDLIAAVLRDGGVDVPSNFRLEDYHHMTAADARAHAVLFAGIRHGFPLTRLPIDPTAVEKRVGEVVDTEVTAHNESFGLHVFNLRVVRPGSDDNNPPHRDVWLDRLRNAVNIYVPLVGSDARSSLPVVPGSHLWSESEIVRTAAGATVNGSAYTVPAVVGAKRPLNFVRPDPAADEFLVFSPYLIHGGAKNLTGNVTRVSLEMRFWRRRQRGM